MEMGFSTAETMRKEWKLYKERVAENLAVFGRSDGIWNSFPKRTSRTGYVPDEGRSQMMREIPPSVANSDVPTLYYIPPRNADPPNALNRYQHADGDGDALKLRRPIWYTLEVDPRSIDSVGAMRGDAQNARARETRRWRCGCAYASKRLAALSIQRTGPSTTPFA